MSSRPQVHSDPLERYRQAVRIDRNVLDRQVEEQPQLYFEICEQQLQALSQRDERADQLERRGADLANQLRGTEKLTEAGVKDRVRADRTYQTIATQLRLLDNEVETWTRLRATFELRAKMLRELVTLFASGYFVVTGRVQARNTEAQVGREALQRARLDRREV